MAPKNYIVMLLVSILCAIGIYSCTPTYTPTPKSTVEELSVTLATATAEKLPAILPSIHTNYTPVVVLFCLLISILLIWRATRRRH
jgi:hypothetical protein